ncbi:hypothetical protein BDR06DRAFT_953127, partial [Suillus hirtellus]
SLRLRQALLTPRQVLSNIFTVSVLISISTLYATSRPTTYMPCQTSPPPHAMSNLTTSTVTLSI